MKRFIIIILTAFLIFTACGENVSSAPKITVPLKITAKLSGSDNCFTARVFETECEITFDLTHSLAGTTLVFDESGGTATVGDFNREVGLDSFPAQNALISALRLIGQSPNSGTKTENGIKYTIDEMTIMVYYDRDTKEITGITTEERARKFEFYIVALEFI